MKKYIKILILLFVITSCHSQIYPLGFGGDGSERFNGAHNKDVDNDFNKFVGTWVYEQNGAKLTMEFRKIEDYHHQDSKFNYYKDVLVGEYKYEENNTVIINTIPNFLTIPESSAYNHNMNGSSFPGAFDPILNGGVNERVVTLIFTDPDRAYIPAKIKLKYKIENGIQKIDIKIMANGAFVEPFENAPFTLRVPNANYTLIKQP